MKERIIVLDTNRSYYDVKQAADNSMTVEELIEELRYLPRDCKVVFRNDNGYTYGYLHDCYINSEYYEPEQEEEDDVLANVDMIHDITEKVRQNDDKPVKIWVDFGEAEAVSVGFNDSRVLGVALNNDEFIPIDELSGDELYEVWSEITYVKR
jgi:hypothetical protein